MPNENIKQNTSGSPSVLAGPVQYSAAGGIETSGLSVPKAPRPPKTIQPTAPKTTGTVIAPGSNVVYENKPQTSTPNVKSALSSGGNEALNRIAEQAYKNIGNDVVGIRDYASGGGAAVDWDGKNALVGGNAITPTFVRDGTAYAPKSVVDKSITDYNRQSGIVGNKQVYDDYMNRYEDKLNNQLGKMTDRKQFEFNPDTDVGYNQYVDYMTDLADRAYKSALARNNTDVGGASAAVLSEAAAARDNYLKQAADSLLDWRQQAAAEYEGETDRLRNNLSDSSALFNDFYNKNYTANRDSVGDARNAQKDNDEREQRDIDNQRNDRNDMYSNLYTAAQTGSVQADTEGQHIQNRGYELANDAAVENNRHTAKMNRFTEASNIGYFTADDTVLIPELLLNGNYINDAGILVRSDGSVIYPWDTEAVYAQAMALAQGRGQYAAANEYGK